jgi:hypothetical protein
MTALARTAAVVNDRSILSSESRLHKDYDLKCSVEKNGSRDSQGAQGAQGELIGSKSPVVN